MFGKLVTHTAIYLAVCTLVSFLWVLMTQGTMDDLSRYVASPSEAVTLTFWPCLLWLVWGTALAIHAGVVLGKLLRPSYWSRQMRHARRLQARGVPRAEAVLTAAGDADEKEGRGQVKASRHVVAMFTDIAGSTTLNETLGDQAWTELLAEHRALVRDCVREHGGTEVNTQGDGFFLRFDEAAEAVDSAIDLQQRLAGAREVDPQAPHVRVGIHLGEAVQHDDDVLGVVVNLAARLMQAGEPDEILITEPVADRVDDVELLDRGLVELKGLRQPRHLLMVRWR